MVFVVVSRIPKNKEIIALCGINTISYVTMYHWSSHTLLISTVRAGPCVIANERDTHKAMRF